jgi:hypothetical protein
MKHKLWFFIMLPLTFLLLLPIYSFNVSADEVSPSGETVIGDSVVWDAPYAYLKVYPHTASDGIRQIQYCDFIWKKPSTSIDLAFIFPMQLMGAKDVFVWKNISHMVSNPVISTFSDSYTIKKIVSYSVLPVTPLSVDFGDIPSTRYYYVAVRNNSVWHNITVGFDSFIWINSSHTGAVFTYSYQSLTGYTSVEKYFFDWVSIKNLFSMEQVGSSFYYYFKGVFVSQGMSYHLKWMYDLPINSHGKWSLMLKLSSDTLSDALDNNRYVMLDPWYNSAWKYSMRIVIDHTKVEVNLYNYPVYFNYSSSSFVHAQSDGDDFMFIALGNATKYNHQIENFSSNRLIAWVNITTLSSTVDTVLYLYYGNAVCSSQANNASTWNSTYVMVYHMKDASSTTVGDSTVNARTLTKQSAGHPLQKKARADSGEKFALTVDYLTSSGKYMPLGMKSVEVWYHSNGSNFKQIYDDCGGGSSANYGLNIYLGPSTNPRLWGIGVYGAGGGIDNFIITSGVGNLSNNKWHYGMLTWDGTTSANKVKLYSDRIMNSTTAVSTEVTASTYNNVFGSQSSPNTYQLYGFLDEVRVSNVVRSRGYFNTTKNCINSSTTFLSVGPEILQDAVVVSAVYPLDASISQIPRPWISVTVYDYYGNHRMNLTFGTNLSGSWRVLGTNLSCVNGTYRQYLVNLTMANKKAWWRVNASDGHTHYVNTTYSFTTGLCNLSTSISETKTNCTGSTSATYVPSSGFSISASYLSKLFDYAFITNSSGTHQKVWDSSAGAFKVWANYSSKVYDYKNFVNATGTLQKAWYSALGAFKVWGNVTGSTTPFTYHNNTHNLTGLKQLKLFGTGYHLWDNQSGTTTPVIWHNNTHNTTGTNQIKLFSNGLNLYVNLSGVTTPFTYHNNTVNVSSVKQLKLFGTGYHLWDNSSSGIMSYTNLINVSGTLQKAWYSALGNFKVWANYTGTGGGTCPSANLTVFENVVNVTGSYHLHYYPLLGWFIWNNYTGNSSSSLGIHLYQNIVNATGTHQYATNATSYLVWANYTGTGGTSNSSLIFIARSPYPFMALFFMFGAMVGSYFFVRKKKQKGL